MGINASNQIVIITVAYTEQTYIICLLLHIPQKHLYITVTVKKKKKNLGLIATKEPLSLLLRGRGTLILKLFASSLFFNYVYFFYCVLMLSIFTWYMYKCNLFDDIMLLWNERRIIKNKTYVQLFDCSHACLWKF